MVNPPHGRITCNYGHEREHDMTPSSNQRVVNHPTKGPAVTMATNVNMT